MSPLGTVLVGCGGISNSLARSVESDAGRLVSLIDPLPQLKKWASKVFHVHGKGEF